MPKSKRQQRQHTARTVKKASKTQKRHEQARSHSHETPRNQRQRSVLDLSLSQLVSVFGKRSTKFDVSRVRSKAA